jgi:hypothetical protein
MSRIINQDSAGKQRSTLVKGIALALRELSRQSSAGDEARDLAAFIALALKEISAGIDPSVAAWEKRGYWVKADRVRMEWAWSGALSSKMQAALSAGDWAAVAGMAAQTAGKISNVQVAEHHRLGKPWLGAFQRLMAESPDKTGPA